MIYNLSTKQCHEKYQANKFAGANLPRRATRKSHKNRTIGINKSNRLVPFVEKKEMLVTKKIVAIFNPPHSLS